MLCRLSRRTPVLLAAALLAAACSDLSDSTGPEETGQITQQTAATRGFTLLLTDAPGDVDAAVVTISEVKLVGEGSNGRVALLSSPVTVDLVTLQNSIATMVSGFDVPEGSYSQMRVVITGGYIEVERAGGGSDIFASSPSYAGLPAGATVDGVLHMPSMGQSGLKIDLPGGKLDIDDDATVVMLDFDVKDSFGHEAGRSGRWIMNPNIKASNVTFGGNVVAQLSLGSGVTLPILNGSQVTLASFNAKLTPVGGGTSRTVTFTDANNDGTFDAMFKGLLPGQYSLEVLLPAGVLGTFNIALPVVVTVTENQTVTQPISLATAALPGSIKATLVLGASVTIPNLSGNPVTLAQFKAQLTPGGGGTPVEVLFTDVNNDLTWEANFPNLVPGSYQLALLAPTGMTPTFNPTSPQAIVLASGAAETKAFTLTGATVP